MSCRSYGALKFPSRSRAINPAPAELKDLNYFSYFSEIEDTFIRRRGKHLMLSPIDWALIESWKERGVPVHVALRGIEHAFDSHDAKKQKRTVKTLLYCQEEVEAQYAEWLESRVGSHDDANARKDHEDTSPFPRATVLAHLARALGELTSISRQRETLQDEFTEALNRAAALLSEIKDDYASAAQPDTRKLEESLTGLERMLDDAMRAVATSEDLDSMSAEIESQLKPYRRHMDKPAFEQTRDNLLRKKMREQFGVPRLSLFFL
jgi:phage terminase Nu1 subunit (DNA packaging protein)